MSLIHILRNGVESDVEESCLVKTEGTIDNEHETTTFVEYRFPGSDVIVHRSCSVSIKHWPGDLGAVLGELG